MSCRCFEGGVSAADGEPDLKKKLQKVRSKGGLHQSRSFPWGPCDSFAIAPWFSGDVQIGWAAKCGLHSNSSDEIECVKRIAYGTGEKRPKKTDDECRWAVKAWLYCGMTIPFDSPTGRTLHVFRTKLEECTMTEAELDAWSI